MFEKTRELIEGGFSTYWTGAGESAVPVKWPNVKFNVGTSVEYLAFHINPGQSANASMGGATTLQRQPGVCQVMVFTKHGSGTKRGLELSDLVAAYFRNRVLTGGGVQVTFMAPGQSPGRRFGDLWRVTVSTLFESDKLL